MWSTWIARSTAAFTQTCFGTVFENQWVRRIIVALAVLDFGVWDWDTRDGICTLLPAFYENNEIWPPYWKLWNRHHTDLGYQDLSVFGHALADHSLFFCIVSVDLHIYVYVVE
jgi:hypothetical protein